MTLKSMPPNKITDMPISMGFCLLAIVLLLLPAQALADSKAPIAAQWSEADAALLAAACSGCHAKAATGDGFPHIYGRPAAEIREALLAFRSDRREGTVMNRIAKGYSEDEIGVLADYLAAQDPTN